MSHPPNIPKPLPKKQMQFPGCLRIKQAITENQAGRRMSSRRLRRSIEAGRILTVDELQSDPADTGVLNHIPFVNRLVGWWGRMRAADWLKTASLEKRAALKRDLHPIIEIYEQL